MRLRVPDEGETVVEDEIRGEVRFPHSAIKDFVIARSDGSPLYNLAVAVDDLDMGITHVVRGEDHLSNTPRQVMVLKALGAEPPVYAHLPLLHGPDGKKLSKRHGAASVQELRDAGYLPEAVRNYIALLGWGLDDETTFITTERADRGLLPRRGSRKSPAVFDEQKLRWMNGRYLRELAPERADRRPLRGAASGARACARRWAISAGEDADPRRLLAAGRVPGRAPGVRREGLGEGDGRRRPGAPAGGARGPARRPSRSTTDSVEAALRGVVERLGVKPKEVFQPVRVAISGTTVSPGHLRVGGRSGARGDASRASMLRSGALRRPQLNSTLSRRADTRSG